MRTILILPLAMVAACASAASSRATYDLDPGEVRRTPPLGSSGSWASVTVPGEIGTSLVFFDDAVHVELLPQTQFVQLRVASRTSGPIRIVWDDAAYVVAGGWSQPLMRASTPFDRRDEPHDASTVAAGDTLVDRIVPSDYLVAATSWETGSLVRGGSLSAAELDAHLETLVGKTVWIVLPVEANGARRRYEFAFTIPRACVYRPGRDAETGARTAVPPVARRHCVSAPAPS